MTVIFSRVWREFSEASIADATSASLPSDALLTDARREGRAGLVRLMASSASESERAG